MSVARDSGAAAGVPFHRLTVKAVRDETADSRSFVLVPERADAKHFRYRPGQFLTFRIPHAGGEIRRSYSLSSAPQTDPDMTICVKRVDGGRGSNWFNDQVMAGVRLEATRPSGRFVLYPGESPILLVAGGSGITPCISLIKHALAETQRKVKLVYANQSLNSVIYHQELDWWARTYPDRFSCDHWLDDTRGFMTADDIAQASRGWEAADNYICGPDPLMDLAEETLAGKVGPTGRILTERFASPEDTASVAPVTDGPAGPKAVLADSFRLVLDGEEHRVPIAGNETLLQAALAGGLDVPHSCTEGHCGSCMARLRAGEVTMTSTRALSKRNIERGLVLACQARPSSSAEIVLDFDL